MTPNPAPSVLTHRQRQFFAIARFVYESGAKGVTRADVQRHLGLCRTTTSGLLEQMVSCRLVTRYVATDEPRQPFRYFIPPEPDVTGRDVS